MAPVDRGSLERAEALVRRIGRLEAEIDLLLDDDECARPSLIPPALAPACPSKPAPKRARGPVKSGRGSEIGQRIRDARRALGMTQLDLALATGIRRPNVARLERGSNTPTLDTLERVAEALEVPLSSLVTGA